MTEQEKLKFMFQLKLKSNEEIILALQKNHGIKDKAVLEIAKLAFDELKSRGLGGNDLDRLMKIYLC